MSSSNTVAILRSRPEGRIKESDIEIRSEPIPTMIEDGQVLVKHIYLSLDPIHRVWMSNRPQFMDPIAIGDVIRTAAVGIVHESKHDDYPVGTYVTTFGNTVCEYFVGIPGITVTSKIDTNLGLPLSAYCSIMTMHIGLTAWYGTYKVLNVKKDDIVVVSGASGAVGSLVGQLCKLIGAKVIGIAGGPIKCQKLKDNLGFDHVIDYKNDNVGTKLSTIAPEGITCYYDNVGGQISDDVIMHFQNFGRMAVCGGVSEYEDNYSGITNFNIIMMRRLTLKGFVCVDHMEYISEAMNEIGMLLATGKLQYMEDIRQVGIDKFVVTLNDIFQSKNNGKLIMQICDEP